MGNRTSKSDSVTGGETYAYNAANMLESRSIGVGYDDGGNPSYTNNLSYDNDANGNRLRAYQPDSGGYTSGPGFAWDSQNRMVASALDQVDESGQSIGGDVTRFTYGADGLRRRKATTLMAGEQTQTDYVLDGQSAVQEVVRRRQSAQQPWSAPETITYLPGPSGPMYRKSSNAAHAVWYVYDGLGSVVGVVGGTNALGQFTTSRSFGYNGMEEEATP